jgi:hypothetical protein
MAAYIAHEVYAPRRADQDAAFCLLGQGKVAPHLGDGKGMTDIARASSEKEFPLALEQRLIKIAGNRELACGLLQLKT